MKTDNNDLVWDLDAFSQRQRAIDFVMGFENKICVFSNSVEQLYTNYNIFFPREEARKLVILPNPYAHHDTFNGIPESAVTATGMEIIPGMFKEKLSLFLRIPFKSGAVRVRTVPLQIGLRIVQQQCPPERPFLPVLMKGDLRELDASIPCLHLHRIHVNRLTSHSNLERSDIEKVIQRRLENLGKL
ncbi:MAG: hypothetical protein EOO52_14920 [Gammaproteobacteria bacterium]|nr:MAG: hypothetical protein EOO52_14920 [Gammaproteobacteria bacterium]